jgi:hypothetical protein
MLGEMAGMITDLKTGDTLDFLWHRQRQRQMELFDDFLEAGVHIIISK